MSPSHAALAARAEQSGIEHFADIVIGRAEDGEVSVFAAARKRGYGNILARTVNLRSRPDGKAVAEDRRRRDPPGETHALAGVEIAAAARVAPALVAFLAKRKASLFVKFDVAVRKIAALLKDRQQHLQRQRLDGEGNRLGGEERPHEIFGGDPMSVKRRENVAPAQRREFKRT